MLRVRRYRKNGRSNRARSKSERHTFNQCMGGRVLPPRVRASASQQSEPANVTAALTDKQAAFTDGMNAASINREASALLDHAKIAPKIAKYRNPHGGNSAPTLKRPGAPQIEMMPIERLMPYAANARAHPPAQVAQIAASIKEFGFITPCVVDKNDVLIAGHGRVLGSKELGLKEVPVIRAEHLSETQVKAFRLADNKIALNADWLDDLLADELRALQDLDFDLSLTGFGDDELAKLFGAESAGAGGDGHAMLADKFMIPPFSVLNAREGWWQERKRQWLALGIQSEVGRGGNLIERGKETRDMDYYRKAEGTR